MPSERTVRFVFVLGTGRCGSSLIHEILAQHPEVGFLSNIEDRSFAPPIAGRWNGALYRRLPPTFTAKGRIRFAPSEGYRLLEREVSSAICSSARDLTSEDATPWLAGRFRRFFEQRARAQGKPIFLHKFTGWPRARFIDSALVEPRFIHVIRDGRAVANSLVKMPWWRGYRGPTAWGWGPLPEAYRREWEASGSSFLVLAGLEWRLLLDAFAEAKATIPADRWLDVRYEDLLHDPTGTTKELIEFTGSTWTPKFDERFRRYRFDDSRTDAFRRDLPPSEIEAIERSLGPWLHEYGYLGPTTLHGEDRR